MQKMPKVAALAVTVKITHHQRGAGCSTTSEMRRVSQLKLRRFRTNGTCAIRRSACCTCSDAAADAPFMVKLFFLPCLPLRCTSRQAFSGWGCEGARDNSFAE